MFKTRDTASAAAVHGGAAGPQPSSTSVAHRHHTTGPHLDRGSPSEPRLSRSPCPIRWRLRSNNTTTTAGLTHGEARRCLHPLRPSSLTPPALFTFATIEPAIRTPGNKAAVWCLRLAVDVHLLGTHPARRPRHARRHLVTRAAWSDTRAAGPSPRSCPQEARHPPLLLRAEAGSELTNTSRSKGFLLSGWQRCCRARVHAMHRWSSISLTPSSSRPQPPSPSRRRRRCRPMQLDAVIYKRVQALRPAVAVEQAMPKPRRRRRL
ncbi:hypothetical protein PVAP13_8KG269588 [Panicum virgatum]|uniref:Uncharacterized protein n=1 Tax=Panicum virgatum TaxID=38727 RepID=A0A8T0PQC5_PANVG|nr:hypothetical protein PVAP13_8KG269588 [Panicum virgatum]